MQEQLHTLLKKLVLKNNIHLHQEELKLQLLSHPSYPSLHSLTGVLNHFGVPNIALRVPTNGDTLERLPSCFIANVELETGDDFVLVEKKKNGIQITVNANTKIIWTVEQFLLKWNEIILVIEKDELIQETSHNSFKFNQKISLFTTFAIVAVYFIFSASTLFSQAHFVLSIIGLVLSIYIVKEDMGLQSLVANNFCNLSENSSCKAVLNSKGAKIFGLIKMSDLSLVTFSAYVFNWLLFAFQDANDHIPFTILTIAALPVVFYSVYYQYNVVKKWCPLCLGIVAVLLLQAGALFSNSELLLATPFELNSTLLFIIGSFSLFIIWSFLKPIIEKSNAHDELKLESRKFKRNFSLFQIFLDKKVLISESGPIPGELVFGNEDAALELIVVTSPFCHYCKKAHSDIESLLSKIGEKLKITIRFNIDPHEKTEPLYKVTTQLLHIYNTKGKEAALHALNEVYQDDVDLLRWIEEQQIEFKKSYNLILERQQDWCHTNSINFTPAVFLNGRSFPQEYDRLDLIYFVDNLIKQQSIAITVDNQLMAS